MKIGIDLTSLCRKITGIEYYTLNLAKSLLSLDKDNEYVLFFRKEIHPELKQFMDRAKFLVCPVNNQIFCEQAWLPYIARKKNLDLIHFPAFPPGLFTSERFIFNLHDATIWKYPKSLSWKGRFYFKPLAAIGARRAMRIVTISESSRRDISLYAGRRCPKVINAGAAAAAHFKVVTEKNCLKVTTERYNLPDKFILSVGSVEPRKNLATVLEAYKKLRDMAPNLEHKLVLVGRKAWGKRNICDKIDNLGLGDEVLMVGHVSDDDLVRIYNLADIFVYPSFYEGFGLPPVEAMACGTPVIASNCSSLPEVLGDAAILIDPYDINCWTDGMANLLRNEKLKEELRQKGLNRSRLFSWEKVARKTIEVYESVKREDKKNV